MRLLVTAKLETLIRLIPFEQKRMCCPRSSALRNRAAVDEDALGGELDLGAPDDGRDGVRDVDRLGRLIPGLHVLDHDRAQGRPERDDGVFRRSGTRRGS
jgi:hypothetical protein